MRNAKIRKAYDDFAKTYDSIISMKSIWARLGCTLVWGFPDTAYSIRLLEYIPNDFSGIMLDVPVGTGALTESKYASLSDAKITCLDYSQRMLDIAKTRFKAAGIANVDFQQGDAGALPFENEAFDIVLSMNGLHAFPDKKTALHEIRRVLKPGGVFMGCCYVKGEVRRTDWIVRNIYVPRSFFTPSFWTKHELENKLENQYLQVKIWSGGAIAGFYCKP